jgi:hypothetical protein
VLDSCSGFDSDFRVDHQRKKSFVAVYGANGFGLGCGFGFWLGDRCTPDHHRTLLKVHSLYFHACYGCAQ